MAELKPRLMDECMFEMRKIRLADETFKLVFARARTAEEMKGVGSVSDILEEMVVDGETVGLLAEVDLRWGDNGIQGFLRFEEYARSRVVKVCIFLVSCGCLIGFWWTDGWLSIISFGLSEFDSSFFGLKG